MSAAGLSLIAVPPVPAIVPELVIVLPTPPVPDAKMPVLPAILPKFVALTTAAWMPKLATPVD